MNETPILLSNVRKGDTVMWGPFHLIAIEDTQAELPDGDKPAGRSCQFRTPLNKPYTLTERGGEQIPLIAAPKDGTEPKELSAADFIVLVSKRAQRILSFHLDMMSGIAVARAFGIESDILAGKLQREEATEKASA